MALKKDTIIEWGCVFKVTFPNNKIYIGSDTAQEAQLDYFKYFGSPKAGRKAMYNDLKEYMNGEYSVKKEILYSEENVKIGTILDKEQYYIRKYNSRDREIGYNR